ncbi:collagen alpha-6(VI) chain-like [Elysia marginata]|uniref:Collagen alpha-6(VI) chain-like n=1 Tax=Elysia marginata TaxID=1093978 RepID=A0AAV4G8J9_9GAST|nr:collagen alpha-6(VI) chain-like [Elysia marginata]
MTEMESVARGMCHGTYRKIAIFLCFVTRLSSVTSKCLEADVALVLDVSESTKVLNLVTDKFQLNPDYGAFLKEFLTHLEPMNNRVGLISYSTNATIESALTSNYTHLTSSVMPRMLTTAQFAQQNTDTGINKATELLVNSGLAGVYRYMVVFLDGTSGEPSKTHSAIVRAGEANITIISISLRGTLQESLQVAGRSFRQFFVRKSSELMTRLDIIEDIASIICAECKGYNDVVFLLDGSDSTRRISADFSSVFYASGVVGLIKNVTAKLAMGPIREGLISYSMHPQVLTPMTGNATVINLALDAMAPEFRSTEAGQAFRKARELLDNATPPRPADVPRYIIYLVDGAVSNDTDLAVEALITRNTGIEVYAAGFSPAAKFNDLLIATGSLDRIRQVDSDLDLGQFVDPLAYYLCQTAPSMTVA